MTPAYRTYIPDIWPTSEGWDQDAVVLAYFACDVARGDGWILVAHDTGDGWSFGLESDDDQRDSPEPYLPGDWWPGPETVTSAQLARMGWEIR